MYVRISSIKKFIKGKNMALQVGGSRIPYLRKKSKVTQLQLAKYLGVSQGFISQVENNQAQLTYEMAMNAAVFLDCQMEDLAIWIEVKTRDRR